MIPRGTQREYSQTRTPEKAICDGHALVWAGVTQPQQPLAPSMPLSARSLAIATSRLVANNFGTVKTGIFADVIRCWARTIVEGMMRDLTKDQCDNRMLSWRNVCWTESVYRSCNFVCNCEADSTHADSEMMLWNVSRICDRFYVLCARLLSRVACILPVIHLEAIATFNFSANGSRTSGAGGI